MYFTFLNSFYAEASVLEQTAISVNIIILYNFYFLTFCGKEIGTSYGFVFQLE